MEEIEETGKEGTHIPISEESLLSDNKPPSSPAFYKLANHAFGDRIPESSDFMKGLQVLEGRETFRVYDRANQSIHVIPKENINLHRRDGDDDMYHYAYNENHRNVNQGRSKYLLKSKPQHIAFQPNTRWKVSPFLSKLGNYKDRVERMSLNESR